MWGERLFTELSHNLQPAFVKRDADQLFKYVYIRFVQIEYIEQSGLHDTYVANLEYRFLIFVANLV